MKLSLPCSCRIFHIKKSAPAFLTGVARAFKNLGLGRRTRVVGGFWLTLQDLSQEDSGLRFLITVRLPFVHADVG